MVIEKRKALSYEACHWVIGVEDNKYRDDTGAYVELFISDLSKANAYIYEGTDRKNVTAFIEGNSTAAAGVPYRAPISAKLILVMTTEPNGETSSASFSYIVHNGIEYPFWQKPFVGEAEWKWFSAVGGIFALPFIFITLCVCCCKYSKCF